MNCTISPYFFLYIFTFFYNCIHFSSLIDTPTKGLLMDHHTGMTIKINKSEQPICSQDYIALSV